MSGRPVPVSVIVPCFRCATTVGRALESVRCQTRPPAEIIVVDDASDDGSAETVAQVARSVRNSPAIRTLSLPSNKGPGGARNAAWAAATQPYIAFLDSDDAWHPRKLEMQVGWMAAHPSCVLTGHAITGSPDERDVREPTVGRVVQVTPSMLLSSNRFQTTSVMLRRSISQRFVGGKRYCEDYLLWLEIVLAGGEAYFLDAVLATRFKPVYGSQGASGRLWEMERGELDALKRVWRAGLLGFAGYVAATTWSWLKFLRRLVVVRTR